MNPNPYRNQREEDLLRELAAKYIERESNRTSLVTVTSVSVTNKGQNAMIFFTVLPDSKEAGVLDFLKRKRAEFRSYVKENSRLSILPFIDFAVDMGERNRQNVDRLI